MKQQKKKKTHPTKPSGILITFEGTEGAGKSTLIFALEKVLLRAGHSVAVTREPGGTEVAEKIRSILLQSPMSPWTELFLYEAARAEHLDKTILPALTRGQVILCDRFTDSTLAYQGQARGLPWRIIGQLNTIATRGIVPALKVFVDIDPARGLKDAQNPNRFEAEGLEFQKSVRQGFLKAIRLDPRRWVRVKARSGTPEEMAEAVYLKLKRKLPKPLYLKTTS